MSATRKPLRLSLLVVIGAALLGQINLFTEMFNYQKTGKNVMIPRYLNKEIGGTTLQSFLQDKVTRQAPLLSNESQALWLALRRPVIGISTLPYGIHAWDDARVSELIAKYGVEFVLVMPSFFTEERYASQPFITQLAEGRAVEWLKPVYIDSDVHLYRVEGAPRALRDSVPPRESALVAISPAERTDSSIPLRTLPDTFRPPERATDGNSARRSVDTAEL